MRRILISIIGFTLFVSASLLATEWNPVANRVVKSLSFLETPEGTCTAWSIDEKKDLVITAGHCFGRDKEAKDILVDQTPVTRLVSLDTKKDLMILEVKGLDKPALRLAKANPRIGDEVASYGFGLGLERPLFRTAHISDDQVTIESVGGPFIMTDTDFIGGQSGGPVVDINGDVVMIVQRGTQGLGIGVGAETIKAKMGKYFEVK